MHVALNRNREIQLLVLDQIAVGDALAATGDDAVLDGKLIFGHAESLSGQIEQRLMNVGAAFRSWAFRLARRSKAPLPSGVRSVSPETTVVIASNGTLSSSATICRYAVNTVP